MDNGAVKMWTVSKKGTKTCYCLRLFHINIIFFLAADETLTSELASAAFDISRNDTFDALNHLVQNVPKKCLTNLKGYLSFNNDKTELTSF